MPDITFIEPDGSEHGLEAPAGVSLMQAATGAGIKGIVADCGGQARCATCHVYVDPAWAVRLPAPKPIELAMLECTAAERRPGSRLSCQITITDEMQDLRVQVPDTQW